MNRSQEKLKINHTNEPFLLTDNHLVLKRPNSPKVNFPTDSSFENSKEESFEKEFTNDEPLFEGAYTLKINDAIYSHKLPSPAVPNKASTDITKNISNQSSSNRPKHESAYSIAKKFLTTYTLKKIDEVFFIWDDVSLHFRPFIGNFALQFIRKSLPTNVKDQFTTHKIDETFKWIVSECEDFVDLSTNDEQARYIPFKNCIYDIKTQQEYLHGPEFNNTSTISANYKNYKSSLSGYHFKKFIRSICTSDPELELMLPALFGYVISDIRTLKILPFLIGPKDCGKSIVLMLLEYLIGKEFCSNLSIDELNNTTFLASLHNKKLNTCGEISEFNISRMDILKKISGGDTIMARPLYHDPISFKNRAVLVFAGNHLPTLKHVDFSGAFNERLLIFPFVDSIPKDKQDPFLIDKLIKEIDYIAQWSLDGLHRLISNNYTFTVTEKSQQIQKSMREENNSLETFLNSECVFSPELRIYNADLEQSYKNFCYENSFVPISNRDFHKTLKGKTNLTNSRFRQGDQNKYGYIGITLKSLMEDAE